MKVSNETTAIAAVGATLLAATVGMGAFMFSAISGVRAEVAELRVEVRADVAELRAEFRGDVAGLRADVADLREHMARLEGLFEGFTGGGGAAVGRAAPNPHEPRNPA